MTKKNSLPDLPDTMSGLIRVALIDLKQVEGDPDYVVNMMTWHEPTQLCNETRAGDLTIKREVVRNVCQVCLAGSVMAKTLKIRKGRWVSSASTLKVGDKLLAIDRLRTGSVDEAASHLCIPHDLIPKKLRKVTSIPDYDHEKPKPFHVAMEKLAADLERHDL